MDSCEEYEAKLDQDGFLTQDLNLKHGQSKPRFTFRYVRNALAGLPVSRRQANHLW